MAFFILLVSQNLVRNCFKKGTLNIIETTNNAKQIQAKISLKEKNLQSIRATNYNTFFNKLKVFFSFGSLSIESIKNKEIQDCVYSIEKSKEELDICNNISVELDSIHSKLFKDKSFYINNYILDRLAPLKNKLEDNKKVFDITLDKERYEALYLILAGTTEDIVHYNKEFIQTEKNKYKKYFENVEDTPLTSSQVEACISNENTNLILAGAGSGKTSVIVARCGYILEKQLAKENEILILAFNKDAVVEIQKRVESRIQRDNITISTFHALGLKIVNECHPAPVILSPLATSEYKLNNFIQDTTVKLIESNKKFNEAIVKYFLEYIYSDAKSPFDFSTEGEYYEYIKSCELITLNGDRVRSFEELMISNFLTLNGIKFEYERQYPHYSGKYEPDFYLTDYDIYFEHFGISRDGRTAPYINSTIYNEQIIWKRELHKENNTKLIESYSYENKEGVLLENLKTNLLRNGVVLETLSIKELLKSLAESNHMNRFISLLATFLNHFKSNQLTIDEVKKKCNSKKEQTFLYIFEEIYNTYTSMLNSLNQIDFNDMINLASKYVATGTYKSPYSYILVDEFQDISYSRFQLVKNLHVNKSTISTYVGDDYQSINQFAGSDISIIRNLTDHFKALNTVQLENTFRFDDRICTVSSTFINKNPSQIKKKIIPVKFSNEPSIYLYQEGNTKQAQGLFEIIKEISTRHGLTKKQKASVMILGRYNFLNPNIDESVYPNLDIEFKTVHSSKGLGADYVVLVGFDSTKYGFPSLIEDDELLNLVRPIAEDYPYAEERRLFYVALTRTKKLFYAIATNGKESPFYKELIEDNQTNGFVVQMNELEYDLGTCPKCKTGKLISRQAGKSSKEFLGCSNYPYCEHTQIKRYCSECAKNNKYSVMKVDLVLNKAICSDKNCSHQELLCPICSSPMVYRKSKYGAFLGCSSYSSTGCTGKIQLRSK